VVSLGSAIFAFLAAGAFKTVEEAQDRICPGHRTFAPDRSAQRTYNELYRLYSKLYFSLGKKGDDGLGDVLPTLIAVAETGKAPIH
jgi:L-ribulokinase